MSCDLTGILISSGSQPIIRRNRVFSSQAAGIEVTNGGGGEIHGNEIFENRFEGICLATGVRPTVTGTFTYILKFYKMVIFSSHRQSCTWQWKNSK